MPDRSIIEVTTRNCVAYQNISASHADDAIYYLTRGAIKPALHSQQMARDFHDFAWERLAQLIGAEQ